MKKISLCLLIIVLVILCTCNSSLAVTTSGNGYIIDLPITYKEQDEGEYKDSNGNAVRINARTLEGNVAKIYSKEFIDQYGEYITTELKERYKSLLKMYYSSAGSSSSDKSIIDTIDSIDVKIKEKEIITATKNKYKCAHFIIVITGDSFDIKIDAYIFGSSDKENTANNKLYSLMLYGPDIKSQEFKDIRNSFTILNYQKPSTADYLIYRYGYFALNIGSFILIAITVYILYKKGQKQK